MSWFWRNRWIDTACTLLCAYFVIAHSDLWVRILDAVALAGGSLLWTWRDQ